MLCDIHITNFAIIENLQLELQPGMTVITGETGAGKSIVIDALDIALGDRVDSNLVRHGAERCEISVGFDISRINAAQNWLEQHELTAEGECLLRRTFSKEGRSKHFVNGHAVTLQQLRELGHILVHVHGQHQHQALVKKDEQCQLIDNYAQHDALLKKVNNCYGKWHQLQKQIEELKQLGDSSAELSLLQYQVEELAELNLVEGELEQLHKEQKQLANAENLLQQCQHSLNLCSDDAEQSALNILNAACAQLASIKEFDASIETAYDLIQAAIIQCDEAGNELRHYLDKIAIDPQRLQQVEQRLALLHDTARKHHIQPEQLIEHTEQLSLKLDSIQNGAEQLQQLMAEQDALFNDYMAAAEKLSKSRKKAAKKMSQLITDSMQKLGMPNGTFQIQCDYKAEQSPQAKGLDTIQFMVSANPGHPLAPLSKVASGGELSRISLAIQLLTASKDATPTLVFDEVDVGIGGTTAAIVGELLRKLAANAQVICITHLPQVAAQGHHHLAICKTTDEATHSAVSFLDEKQRIEEIARMVGGLKITKQSLAHAKAMLQQEVSA